jgi:hypothetical protein
MSKRMACGLALLSVLSTGACGAASLYSSGPYPASQSPAEGLQYHLGRDVLTVQAQVIQRREWTRDKASGECVAGDAKRIRTVWDVAAVAVPDRRHTYRLGVVPKRTAGQNVKLSVSEQGLLTALNYSSHDRTAEIIANVAQGVAGVAGTFVGIPFALPTKDVNYATPPRRADLEPDTANDVNCFREGESEVAMNLQAEVQSARNNRNAVRAARDRIATRIANATSSAQVRQFAAQDSLLERREALLEGRVTTATAAFVTAMRAFAVSKGVKEDTVRVWEAFDLSDLKDRIEGETNSEVLRELGVATATVTRPAPTGRDEKDSSHGPSLVGDIALAAGNDARATGSAGNRRQQFFKTTGLTLTVAEMPPGDTDGPEAHDDKGSIGCRSTRRAAACTKIHFRQPIPREIRIYHSDGDSANSRVVLKDMRRIAMISSDDRVQFVAFTSKEFGEGKVNLAFGPRGNLVGLEQESNAALASATGTLANALTNAREEFLKGVGAVQTTQGSIIGMQNDGRAARIQELKDRKAILDAQLSLDGSAASRTLVAEKQSVDAQLALLQSQQALTSATAGGANAGELSTLRAELDRLKVELELVQKRLELEKLKNGGNP